MQQRSLELLVSSRLQCRSRSAPSPVPSFNSARRRVEIGR